MDLGTIVGIIGGFALIITAIVLGGGALAFINIPSVLITVGGTIAATLTNYPLPVLVQLVKIVRNALFFKLPSDEEVIAKVIEVAYGQQKEGSLGVEKVVQKERYYFLVRSANLLMEGFKGSILDGILLREMHSIKERHRLGQDILLSMGNYAPAFGMIGTLIGLIQMLRNLNDPSTIGYGMSVALLTTLYGALLGNLVFLPLSGKLKERSTEELQVFDLIREGMVAIAEGNKPRVVRERVLAFLDRRARQKLQK